MTQSEYAAAFPKVSGYVGKYLGQSRGGTLPGEKDDLQSMLATDILLRLWATRGDEDFLTHVIRELPEQRSFIRTAVTDVYRHGTYNGNRVKGRQGDKTTLRLAWLHEGDLMSDFRDSLPPHRRGLLDRLDTLTRNERRYLKQEIGRYL